MAALAALVLPGQGRTWSISLPGEPAEQHATGRVTGVADGDTMYVEIGGKSTRVRLAEIDAPEKAQPFGRRSEQALRDLVAKKVVSLSWRTIDPYGRPVVDVRVGTLNVNAEQVKRGYAWVYRQYSHDRQLIADEQQAKASGLGLWADPHPIPPWDWRKDHKGR
ncbi:thermonuclease family protein [Aquabacterium soli]|nr:thermonuclease family protein [Aquabacterium soli]